MRFTLIATCALFSILATAAPMNRDSSIDTKANDMIIRKSTRVEPHRITLGARKHEDGVAGDDEGGEDGEEGDDERARAANAGSKSNGKFFQPMIQTTANPTINTVGQAGDSVVFNQGGRASPGIVTSDEA